MSHLETADLVTELPEHGERDAGHGSEGQDPADCLGICRERVASIVGWHVARSQQNDDKLQGRDVTASSVNVVDDTMSSVNVGDVTVSLVNISDISVISQHSGCHSVISQHSRHTVSLVNVGDVTASSVNIVDVTVSSVNIADTQCH